MCKSQGQSDILADVYASVGTPPGQFRESGFGRVVLRRVVYGVLLGLEATCVIQAENYFTDVTMLAPLGKIHGEEHIFISQRKKISIRKKNLIMTSGLMSA